VGDEGARDRLPAPQERLQRGRRHGEKRAAIQIEDSTTLLSEHVSRRGSATRLHPPGISQRNGRDGHCRHVLREGTKTGKVVLVANCGFWEMDNFDPMIRHMQAFAKNVGREFAGSLVRPCGESYKGMIGLKMPVEDIGQAAEQAGYQLVAEGSISTEAVQAVSRAILPLEKFIKTSNRIVGQMLAEAGHSQKEQK